jgi:alpha-tubulin suppressor-like RCC1 family protein
VSLFSYQIEFISIVNNRYAFIRIIQLSACGFHTGCLTADGELYSWGEGKFGRLGHGAERNCHVPRLVETLLGKRPRQVSCGGFHTAVVTEDGRLYTFGGGEHGQLGHNDRVNKVKPTFVQALDGVFVSQITCGWSHSVALTSKGRIFTWGNGDHGKVSFTTILLFEIFFRCSFVGLNLTVICCFVLKSCMYHFRIYFIQLDCYNRKSLGTGRDGRLVSQTWSKNLRIIEWSA